MASFYPYRPPSAPRDNKNYPREKDLSPRFEEILPQIKNLQTSLQSKEEHLRDVEKKFITNTKDLHLRIETIAKRTGDLENKMAQTVSTDRADALAEKDIENYFKLLSLVETSAKRMEELENKMAHTVSKERVDTLAEKDIENYFKLLSLVETSAKRMEELENKMASLIQTRSTPEENNEQKRERALESIRSAKKAVPIIVSDCYFDTLVIDKSCVIKFVNCTATSLTVTGDWTIAKLKGLKLMGIDPCKINSPLTTKLNECEILSQNKPILLENGSCVFKNCKISVCGDTSVIVKNDTSVSFLSCKIDSDNKNGDINFCKFSGSGKCNLESSSVKLESKPGCMAVLTDCEMNSYPCMNIKRSSLSIKIGTFFSSRTGVKTCYENSEVQEPRNLINLINEQQIGEIEKLIRDPAFSERTVSVLGDIENEEGVPFLISDKKILFKGQEGIELHTFNVNALYDNCRLVFSDLKLRNLQQFKNCRLELRNCSIDGEISFKSCKVKLLKCSFLTESKVICKKGKIVIKETEANFCSFLSTASNLEFNGLSGQKINFDIEGSPLLLFKKLSVEEYTGSISKSIIRSNHSTFGETLLFENCIHI